MRARKQPQRQTIEQIVERLFRGDTGAEVELRKMMIAIIRRYPPKDYAIGGFWSDELIEEICSGTWENIISRGLDRFWFLSGAGEKRIKTGLKNLVFNVMIKFATPEQQSFQNTVVKPFNSNKKLFTKKKRRDGTFMGMTSWLQEDRPISTMTREELLQIWRENIKWPNMAFEKPEKEKIYQLFKEMLELIMEWVRDAHFYNNYRKLINFPKPGPCIKLEADDHESLNLDIALSPVSRDRLNIGEYDKTSYLIAENRECWKKRIQEVLNEFSRRDKDGNYREDDKPDKHAKEKEDLLNFLYNLQVRGMSQTHAAEAVGRSAAFATNAFKKLTIVFSEFRDTLDPEELPAMSRYLVENIKALLKEQIDSLPKGSSQ